MLKPVMVVAQEKEVVQILGIGESSEANKKPEPLTSKLSLVRESGFRSSVRDRSRLSTIMQLEQLEQQLWACGHV